MSKPVISPVADPILQKNFRNIQQCLDGGVSIENMNFRVVTGTTADEPDTQQKVAHSMIPRPVGWMPLIGDVYIQEISDKYIDVRATKPGVNFKILVLGGSPVTGESLVEVGSTGYQSTTQVIQSTPVIEITNITDATIRIKPTVIQVSTGQSANPSGGLASAYAHVVNDSNYFYVTQTGTSNANRDLIRISKTTGVSSSLTLGTRQLGPMFILGSTLYVSQQTWDGVDTILVFAIDTSAFTSSTITINALGSTVTNVTDIFVDGTTIYLSARDAAAAAQATLTTAAIAGGAGNILVTGSGAAGRAGRKLFVTGTNIWQIIDIPAASANGGISQITRDGLTLTTTFNFPGNDLVQSWNGVMIGTNIYVTGFPNGSATDSVGEYMAVMYVFDTLTGAYSLRPLSGYKQTGAGIHLNCAKNVVGSSDGRIISLVAGSFGTTLNIYTPEDDSQALGWFPSGGEWQSAPIGHGLNNSLVSDYDTGDPIVIISPSATNGATNFEYFYPDFSGVQ